MISVTSVQMSLPEQLAGLLHHSIHNVQTKVLAVLLPTALRENASYNRFHTKLVLFYADI